MVRIADDRRTFWAECVEREFLEHGGAQINRALGYDNAK